MRSWPVMPAGGMRINKISFQNTYDTYEGGNFIMTYPTTKSRYEEWYQLIKNQFNAQVTYENTFNERHYF